MRRAATLATGDVDVSREGRGEFGEVRLIPGLPREIAQVMTGYEPIAGLLN